MSRQKRYGNRPRHEPIFRLSPFLVSSPPKQSKANINELTDQLNAVTLESCNTPTQKTRAALSVKSVNEQSPAQNTRSKTKHVKSEHADDLADLVSSLAIDEISRPQKSACITSSVQRIVSAPSMRDHYTAPLLQLSTEPADQPHAFSTWSSSIEQYFNIVKIAEASYGEVYRLVLKNIESRKRFHRSDESVLKVLALKPPSSIYGVAHRKKTKAQIRKESLMSAVDNVAAEVKLLQRMADIPGFTNFRDVQVLRGQPSKAFAKAWSDFNDNQPEDEKSQFPDPSRRGSYAKDQLWAVIEMQDAGLDLEHVTLSSIFSIWDVFWGVTLALAKGEQEAEFEHRDLHMGNICVKAIEHNAGRPVEDVVLSNLDRKYGFTGLETTIIDYTLSRADTGGQVEFLDLSTEASIFEGDADVDYQYELYRYMRSAMYFDNVFATYSQEEAIQTGRQWAEFHPQTNLLWLHLILHEMLSSPDFSWPSKVMKNHVKNSIEAESKVARQKAKDIEAALKSLKKSLRVQNIPSAELASASDLVRMALSVGWLDEIDVVGDGDTTLSLLLS